MLQRFSLKTKLFAAFGLLAILMSVVSGINLYYTKKIDREYSFVANDKMPDTVHAFRLRVILNRIARFLPQMGMDLSEGQFDAKIEDQYRASLKEYDDVRKEYLEGTFSPEEERLFKAWDAEWVKVTAITERAIKIAKAVDRSQYETYEKLLDDEFTPGFDLCKKASDELLKLNEMEAAEAASTASADGRAAVLLSSVLCVVGILLNLGLGYVSATYLSRSLALVAEKVRESSTQVASAAQQIASSSTELSESSVEQAAAIQETAASVDEVSAMIKKNSENAARSMTSSEESKEVATRGNQQVETMVQSIGAIAEANERIMRQVEEGNREIAEIVKVINDIGSKTKVINDIVFQTKLLSFNASVEAARAGEHGKGFAVVAEEVGNLAQMSGNAAKEITEMLDASVKKVEGIVARTKESVAGLIADAKGKVSDGTDVAKLCGDALVKIVGSVSSVDQLVSEIAHASREQATGMAEITKAMAQLDQATNQNSSVSQSCASASEQLSGQAQAMKGLVAELDAILHGAKAGAGATTFETAPKSFAPAKTSAPRDERTAKVIPLNRPAPRAEAPRKAAGGELPSAHDPRFEDV